jgi:hypothetical protein
MGAVVADSFSRDGAFSLVASGWWLVAGGQWLVVSGWWLVAGGWWRLLRYSRAGRYPAASASAALWK